VFTAAFNAVVRALLAPTCAVCDRPLSTPLDGAMCGNCLSSVRAIAPPICLRCGDQCDPYAGDGLCARCRRGRVAVALARSAGVYDGALRDMIHALKYRQRRMIAPWLAARMRREGAEVLAGADAVVPVPLHAWRQWQRGFNQADDLACGLHLPVWRVLRRHRGGPPQSSLPAADRGANARGAYALCRREHWRPLAWNRLRGATVVLVDDVMTTGATLNECARVLQEAGAKDVRALTAARAVAAPPPQQLQSRHLSIARR
jgi:ComF family protein